MIRTGNKTIKEHRLIMKPILLDALGELFPDKKWIVHHRDGDKSNNDLFNLEIMEYSKHARSHNVGNQHKLGKVGKRPYACYTNKNINPFRRVWTCNIRYNDRYKCLGVFEDFVTCEIVANLVLEELNDQV